MNAAATGYLHRAYAESFAEFGSPRELTVCGGWIIQRSVPQTTLRDGMGCYPLFACRDWGSLAVDLNALGDDLVSLTLVTDPFGNFDADLLSKSFDHVRAYKPHYVTDLQRPVETFLRGHHRRNAAKALDRLEIETIRDPAAYLDEWINLYSQLVQRHEIRDLRAFSPRAFERQLLTPGLVMFRATADGEPAGLHLWYVQGEVAYGHLGATSAVGYERMAAYGLYRYAIGHFREKLRWLDLGAAAGLSTSAGGGLDDFKAGWATGTRDTFLCGRIFQRDRYDALTRERAAPETNYFPAYRAGEFARANRS